MKPATEPGPARSGQGRWWWWERTRRLDWGQWFVLGGVLASLTYAVLRARDAVLALQCPWRGTVGVRCSFCGTTTTLHHLLHGDVPGALATNPAIALIAMFGALYVSLILGQLVFGRRLRLALPPRVGRGVLVLFLLGVAVNWVYVLSR